MNPLGECHWSATGLRYNARGPEGLVDVPRAGRRGRLTAAHRAAVVSWIDDGPDLETDGVSRWRLADIREKVLAEISTFVSARNRSADCCAFSAFRMFRRVPFTLRAAAAKLVAFRRDFRRLAPDAAPEETDPEGIEIWLQDEARAGQKGMLSRVWTRKGSRPRVVRDHRYGYAVLFAAVRPANPVAVGHICDRANADEMNRHLADIAAAVPPGHHAVLVLDGAGWHRAKRLEVPANISLMRLPPYSPELNPTENVFAFLKGAFLANRVFATVQEVRDGIASAWTSLPLGPRENRIHHDAEMGNLLRRNPLMSRSHRSRLRRNGISSWRPERRPVPQSRPRCILWRSAS